MSIDAMTEQVLVAPTELLHRLGHFQGFCPEPARYLAALLDPRQTSYRPRAEMEQDPSFKQLIPYVIFTYRAPGGGTEVFRYTRGSGQGEARLHSKRSVGVGGHISIEDRASEDAVPYREGMLRELHEEVVLEGEWNERCVGLINDDETPVGRVHLGVVHLVELTAPILAPRESQLLEAGFAPVEEHLRELERYETWSQYCLRALFGGEVVEALRE